MKSLLVAIVALSLATVSCTKTQDDVSQSSNSEIQTRRGGGGSTTGTTNTIPAPTGLTATAVGGGQVALAWNAVSGGTSYWVYRDNIVLAIVTTTSFTDVYAGAGTHSYAVAAVVNSNLGSRSSSVSVTSW